MLTPAKIFSLITHNKDPDIIETIESSVERTKDDYKKLLKKFERNQDLVFEPPTLKVVIAEIEENRKIDEQLFYQVQKMKHYRTAKKYIADHCCFLIKSIINYNDWSWFEDDIENADGNTNDHLVFQICKVLISTVFPLRSNNVNNNTESYKSFKSKPIMVFLYSPRDETLSGFFCSKPYLVFWRSSLKRLSNKPLLFLVKTSTF